MTDQENQINNQDLPEQRDPVKVQKPDVGSSPNLENPKKDDTVQPEIVPQQESNILKERKKSNTPGKAGGLRL